ncbi:alanine racemase [Leucobacter weissii]|uniref:Alanine racemase n=2 Tax=Leucobacter weissii TaxID=1983706 RepID=A0A939MSZ1_9MICO|nr:alanine racemase [Leucobacter weissii]MBO1902434.1 alanine racemase [Leucobacter weissii]
MTLDLQAVRRNERTMLDWVGAHGAELFPHGKTTMSPALWRQALEAGAHGITFATGWQARAGLEHGVPSVMLANNLVDPVAIRSLTAFLDRHPERRMTVWADSVPAVRALESERRAIDAETPVDVLVDVGAGGGRTGARSLAEVRATAEAITAAATLRLAGVTGWEGPFGADRSARSLTAVRDYLDRVGEAARLLHREGLIGRSAPPIVSAGGSAYPDLVLERLGGALPELRLVLRSGAFQVHDDGLYTRVSPLREGSSALEPSMRVWARVLSIPEAGLALLDAGKRDLAFDVDLPIVLDAADLGGDAATFEVVSLNDQHAFLTGSGVARLNVGQVVPLGLSHPCTVFDKWPVIATVEGAASPDPVVTGAIATLF